MRFINIQSLDAIVNFVTIFAALWLVSDAPLSNSDLITDPWTR